MKGVIIQQVDQCNHVILMIQSGTLSKVQAIDLRVRRDHRKEMAIHDRDSRGCSSSKSSRREDEIVAIKIVRNVNRFHQSALIEAGIIKDVNSHGGRGQSLSAVIEGHFEFDGHCCLVFDKLGRNLYDYLKRHNYEPFPLYCVKDFARLIKLKMKNKMEMDVDMKLMFV
jgi:hypothetical protein